MLHIARAGRNYHFETRLYDYQNTNETGASIRPDAEDFGVVGYPYLESGAGATTPSLILVLSAGVVAIVASLSTGGVLDKGVPDEEGIDTLCLGAAAPVRCYLLCVPSCFRETRTPGTSFIRDLIIQSYRWLLQ